MREAELKAVSRAGGLSVDAGTPVKASIEALPEARAKLWRAAAEGDPIDLQRLADREGVDGLLEQTGRGGAMARTSLQALPFAEGRELALGRLCRLLGDTSPQERAPLLMALHRILAEPAAPDVQPDPEGANECRRALAVVLTNPLTPSEVDWSYGASDRLGR